MPLSKLSLSFQSMESRRIQLFGSSAESRGSVMWDFSSPIVSKSAVHFFDAMASGNWLDVPPSIQVIARKSASNVSQATLEFCLKWEDDKLSLVGKVSFPETENSLESFHKQVFEAMEMAVAHLQGQIKNIDGMWTIKNAANLAAGPTQ